MADFFPMFTVLFNNQTILVHGVYKNTNHIIFNGGLFFVDPPQQTTFSEYFTRVFLGKFSFSFQLLFKHLNPLTDEAHPINTHNFWLHFPENTPNIYRKFDTANNLQNKIHC